MTQTTDQERAKFDAWWREYGLGDYDTQFEAWQAARRVQVVPRGWKLVPKEATPEMLEQVWYLGYDEMRDAYCVLVAAAPQPPDRKSQAEWECEVRKHADGNDGAVRAVASFAKLHSETAPVQMPEPFTSLVRKKSWSPNCYEASPLSNAKDYGRQWADERINVYTEHQVRQLLAAHGIK